MPCSVCRVRTYSFTTSCRSGLNDAAPRDSASEIRPASRDRRFRSLILRRAASPPVLTCTRSGSIGLPPYSVSLFALHRMKRRCPYGGIKSSQMANPSVGQVVTSGRLMRLHREQAQLPNRNLSRAPTSCIIFPICYSLCSFNKASRPARSSFSHSC